jgi:hypothetical protein
MLRCTENMLSGAIWETGEVPNNVHYFFSTCVADFRYDSSMIGCEVIMMDEGQSQCLEESYNIMLRSSGVTACISGMKQHTVAPR